MTAYPAWTPAPRAGIVPLHPFGFGTTLGRSFMALRQNPAVLLGFALCVQALAYIVVLVATGGVAVASFSRLDTVPFGGEDFEAIFAGSIALTAGTGLVLSIAAGALTVIVQGIVVSEVTAAAVAEKRTLGELWRRVRPAAWRLIGYSAMLVTAVVLTLVVVGGLIVALGFAVLPAAIVLGILLVLGAIPLTWWLNVKLLLVPAILIVERAGIGVALARSWRLTRTRFWPTLGVLVIISFTFGAIAQVVGIPFQIVAGAFSSLFAPTGEPDTAALVAFLIVGLLTQVVTILIQCVALIVQSTATTLIYIDSRMRHEGLDLDLAAYVERRDAGGTALDDPYTAHIGRTLAPRPPVPYGVPASGPALAGAPVPPAPPYAPSSPVGAPAPHLGAPGWGPPPGPPRQGPPAPGVPVPAPPAPAPAPSATSWAPPGASAEPGRP